MRTKIRRCRVCGCTDDDCRQCIEKTGEPCYWVEDDLCSACAGEPNLDGEDGELYPDDDFDEDDDLYEDDYEDDDFDGEDEDWL
jgi:hypothetical protein